MEHVSWPNCVKIEVLLLEIPCIISYAEFREESISGVFNGKSSSVWPFFPSSMFSTATLSYLIWKYHLHLIFLAKSF